MSCTEYLLLKVQICVFTYCLVGISISRGRGPQGLLTFYGI